MQSTTLSIAWRNLGRNRKRTLLAVTAIAIGQIVVVFVSGVMNGMFDQYLDAITGPLIGHVQIHHKDWREERAIDLYLDGLADTRAALEALPGVKSVSPRILSAVLAASGEETEGPADAEAAMILGIDTQVESEQGGILDDLGPDEIPEGRGVVLGKIIANRLGIEAGQLIALIGVDAEEFPVSDLFEVRAVIRTDSELVNRLGVVMSLSTAQEFLALPDQAHELVIRGVDLREAEALAITIAGLESMADAEVLPWKEALGEVALIFDLKEWFDLIFVAIVFLAAAAGIANTMMMSTFERTHEFGMLLALGTHPRRITSMILIEAVVLGLLGVAVGSAIGIALVLVTSRTGIDYGVFAGPGADLEVSFQGIVITYVFYPKLVFHTLFYGAVAVTVTSILAALWPASLAGKLMPAEAMRS